MSRLHLVRHGRASAGWDTDRDPGLDAIGRRQAEVVGELLAPLGPLPIVTSPLRRCRETAAPLAARWGVVASVEPRVGEIPSPEGVATHDRVEWLRGAMRGTWSDLGDRYTEYRDTVVSALRALAGGHEDVVVFSHFVAINTVIGAIGGDDRVLIHRLDNCSVTIVDDAGDGLRLLARGVEADTQIR